MLNLIDAILVAAFKVVPAILFIGASIVAIVGAVASLVADVPLKQKLHWIGLAMVLVCCTVWFLGFLGSSPWTAEDVKFAAACNPEFPDYSFLPSFVAMLFAGLIFLLGKILNSLGVPMIVVGVVYLGILAFGL